MSNKVQVTTSSQHDAKLPVMRRLSDEPPPKGETLLFIWWFRGGFEGSQKTLGFVNNDGSIAYDFTPAGGKPPTFWSYLNGA